MGQKDLAIRRAATGDNPSGVLSSSWHSLPNSVEFTEGDALTTGRFLTTATQHMEGQTRSSVTCSAGLSFPVYRVRQHVPHQRTI